MSAIPIVTPLRPTDAERAAQREERLRVLDQMYGYFATERS